MTYSVVTQRGQTTIPKSIRQFLGVHPSDTIVYVIDRGRVVLEPVSGDITDLRGQVKHAKGAIDFKELRAQTKKKMRQKF